ncbi:TonB-dependent siderophore receptor [Veillonella sp. VA142]|uniref:TonB-dependent receptor plug domain-containing protein n=1 Tax=Veillonella sp. VA142 TaxID=741834 RepID=UPI000F8EC249|nr:TonB-dependent receptor [Veillonella sp. VA142]
MNTLLKASLCGAIFSTLLAPIYVTHAMEASDNYMAVVTASKQAETIRNSSAAVQLITQDDMKRLGADTVESALQLVENINLSEAGMTGNQVMIRGMESRHSLVLVNGRRLAGEDASNTTNVYTLRRINLDQVNRIEIVRGPSSALYGSDAMGGIINIITKQPTDTTDMLQSLGVSSGTKHEQAYYALSSGNQGRWNASFNMNVTKERPINRHMSEKTFNTRTKQLTGYTEGYRRIMYGQKQSYNSSVMYDFKNPNLNTIKVDFSYFKEKLHTDNADKYATVFHKSGMVFAADSRMVPVNLNKTEYFNNKSIQTGITYSGRTNRNNYEIGTYYSQLDKSYLMIDDRTLPEGVINVMMPSKPPKPPTPLKFDYQSLYPATDNDTATYKNIVLEGKDTMYVGDHHDVMFGGEYRRVIYEGTRLGGLDVHKMKQSKKFHYDSWATFVEDLWRPILKLSLTSAIRYENNSQFGHNITPKLGVVYEFDIHTRVKFNFGKGYKAPSISELYLNMFHTTPMGVLNIIGNPNLKPETSTSFDIALEAERGKTFGKASYYHTRVSNLIDTKQIESDVPGVAQRHQYYNIGKAKIQGMELSIGHKFTNRFMVKGTYNLVDAKDMSTNERLSNRPRSVSTLQLIYDDHKSNGYSAILWNSFTHKYGFEEARNRGTSSYNEYSFNTLNFSINKKWNNGLSAYVGIDNLLNREVHDLYIDGRMYRIGMEIKL